MFVDPGVLHRPLPGEVRRRFSQNFHVQPSFDQLSAQTTVFGLQLAHRASLHHRPRSMRSLVGTSFQPRTDTPRRLAASCPPIEGASLIAWTLLNSSVYCLWGGLPSFTPNLRTLEVTNFLLYVKSRQCQCNTTLRFAHGSCDPRRLTSRPMREQPSCTSISH